MGTRNIFRYLLVRMLLVDVLFTTGATISWLTNLDISDLAGTLVLCAVMFVVKVLMWVLFMRHMIAPLRVWEQRGSECGDAELLAADYTADRLPLRLALTWCMTWLVYFSAIIGLAWFVLPWVLSFGWLELTAMVFQIVTLVSGPMAVMLPLLSLMLLDEQIRLGAELGARSLEKSREPAPMASRTLLVILGMVLSTACWLSAMGWLSLGNNTRQAALDRAGEAVRWSAHQLTNGATSIEDAHEIVTRDQLPPELTLDGAEEAGVVYTTLDKRLEQVTAAAPVGDGRWVLTRAPVVFAHSMYWSGQLVVVLIGLFGTFMVTLATGRVIMVPLAQLRDTLRRLSEVGDLGEVDRITVVRKDEIGALSHEFNGMLDTFDELARAARAVADGDLRVKIDGRGDLHEAFRAMVARLAELVVQIRDAALETASAASEIHAATMGQEQASGQQSEGIREVSVAMQGLAESASNISAAADEVLSNAQRTRTRADVVVDKIGELGGHISRVGELLEIIREVADRSDLLALNGSLEATRAGEAGRGFALVASEMRRLAERVTGTVIDVRATVTDIGAANQGTVAAIEESRDLADHTTHAARRIVEATRAQSDHTTVVSAGAQDIADIVAGSVAATSQTRAAADGLRERARQLERLIEHFDVGDSADGVDDADAL